MIHGNVAPPGPTGRFGEQLAEPGLLKNIGSGSTLADHGGIAVSKLEKLNLTYQRPKSTSRPVSLVLPPRHACRPRRVARPAGSPAVGRRWSLAADRCLVWTRGGVGKTTVAVEYAHRHLAE